MLWRRKDGEKEAARGVAGATERLPFADRIQRSFGHHDLGDTAARVGGSAAEAGRELGATAYTYGNDVGFRSNPDLHLAAHEAAHIVQQRAGVASGDSSKGSDRQERQADQVADLVVAGRSAQGELDGMAAGGSGRPARLVQRQQEPQRTYVVQRGENVRQIAEKNNVTVDALIEANRDKLQTWPTKDGPVKGFNAGEELIIPDGDQEAATEPGLVESVLSGAAEMVQGVGQSISDFASGVADTVGGIVGAGTDWLFGDNSKAIVPGTPGEAEEGLPAAVVADWVEIGLKCNNEKRAAGKQKLPFNGEQIDAWLVELDMDLDKSADPAQKRILAGVKFQLESTKHGTIYKQAVRDFNFDKTFDCSEAVQYMMMEAGLGDIFGEATETLTTLYMTGIIQDIFGSNLHGIPEAGDIMMWEGHTALVLEVRAEERLFIVSHMGGSGSWINAFDMDDHTKSDSKRGTKSSKGWGTGPVLGYWSAEDATLPASIGTARIAEAPDGEFKYFKPEVNSNYYMSSEYPVNESVDILKKTAGMALVHRPGTRSAAWVRMKNIKNEDLHP